MATPYLSEIKILSFDLAPPGWARCDGQLLPINQNQALFALLGTTYGGDGKSTFALPNLRGRVPIHTGKGHTLGEAAGSATETVTIPEMPAHTHVLNAHSDPDTETSPAGNVLAKAPVNNYGGAASLVSMHPGCVTSAGSSQPHNNMMPYLTLSFIIALSGVFPKQP